MGQKIKDLLLFVGIISIILLFVFRGKQPYLLNQKYRTLKHVF